jgi:hypothetical protein
MAKKKKKKKDRPIGVKHSLCASGVVSLLKLSSQMSIDGSA